MKEIKINNETYVLKSDVQKEIALLKNKKVGSIKVGEIYSQIGKYVICRTYSAGVFAGTLVSKEGQEVVLSGARRLWYWDGAASLSQLAMEGVTKPQNCKFPCEVEVVNLTQAIEILDVTEKAKESIASVAIWQM